jgi:phenylalanyl-tRNA synthetase alpha chain
VTKGSNFSTSTAKPETDLTVEMLTSYDAVALSIVHCLRSISGAWKTSQFKKYNFEAEGALPSGGALHPLLKVREEIRNIFLEMG